MEDMQMYKAEKKQQPMLQDEYEDDAGYLQWYLSMTYSMISLYEKYFLLNNVKRESVVCLAVDIVWCAIRCIIQGIVLAGNMLIVRLVTCAYFVLPMDAFCEHLSMM